MFAMEKGGLHFWVFDTGERLLIIPDINTLIVSKELLLLIRNNLTLFATYHLMKISPLDKQKALGQYFAQKGWKIRPFCSKMYVDDSGDLLFG
jgi:hypothetical protein